MIEEEEQWLIRYNCYLFNTPIEGTEGSLVIWASSERPPQVGDYDEIELGGLNVQRVITEVMKVKGNA